MLDDLGLRVILGPGWGLEAIGIWPRLSVKKKPGPEAWVSLKGGCHLTEGLICQIEPTMEAGKHDKKLGKV